MPVAKRKRAGSVFLPHFFSSSPDMAVMMPRPMGNIMAVVAVLLIHMEMKADMAP